MVRPGIGRLKVQPFLDEMSAWLAALIHEIVYRRKPSLYSVESWVSWPQTLSTSSS